ncbi:Uncharacterized protein ToN1_43890 [Aromatoleum petrolei]|nr:Uncharacterized protein ToN1_43890 [Aromatoleum petrolei]
MSDTADHVQTVIGVRTFTIGAWDDESAICRLKFVNNK